MIKRGVARLFTAAATVALMTGVAHAEGAKIGALMPMTGDLQAYGKTSYNGVNLAVKDINAAGGVLGGELEVSVGDTQTNSQAGIDAAQKLVSIENVSGMVGALSSGVTIPVAQSVTADAEVPQISNASTSPVITGLEDNDYLFRTVPSDAFQGVALAEVAQEKGFGNVGILYINNDYGEGLAESFGNAFTDKGGEVTAMLAYEPGNASYRGELSKAASEGAEALVLVGYPENGITIIRQALEEGYFQNFVFTDGLKAPEIIESIGAQYLNGSAGTAPQAMADSTSHERFTTAYEAEYGELPPKPYIDTAYDAAYVLGLAIEKAGSTDGVAVRDALRDVANASGERILPGEFAKAKEMLAAGKDIDYVGASGSIEFDAEGDVSGTFAHWEIEDGAIVTKKVFEPTM